MTQKKVLAAVTLSLALYSCGSNQTETTEEDNSVLVRVTPLEEKTVARELRYTADLEANEQVYLAPTLSGTRIKKINVEVGDKIYKGQVLVEMDESDMVQQELQLKNLEIEYNRAVKLMETGSISQQDFDSAEMQYEVAKTAYNTLRENTKLLAPFNGVVTGKYMEEGELYTGAAYNGAAKPSIISIEQTNPIKAYINLAEQYYLQVKKGMEVTMTSEIYGDREFTGKINIVYPSIDKSSRTFSCEVLFNNNDEALRPGMYGTIHVDAGATTAKIVQAQAVLKVQGSNDRYIFVAEGNKAKRVTVKIVNRYEDYLEIEATDYDLKAGDQIVTTGQANLIDNSDIKIVE